MFAEFKPNLYVSHIHTIQNASILTQNEKSSNKIQYSLNSISANYLLKPLDLHYHAREYLFTGSHKAIEIFRVQIGIVRASSENNSNHHPQLNVIVWSDSYFRYVITILNVSIYVM